MLMLQLRPVFIRLHDPYISPWGGVGGVMGDSSTPIVVFIILDTDKDPAPFDCSRHRKS